MRLKKRLVLEWGITRVRAAARRRGVRRGVRIVCHSSGWVWLEPGEILGPGPGEILVRSTLSAVSPGTERALYNRLPNTQVTYPYTPGYSAVGTVLEVGRNVLSPRPGERVAGQLPHASIASVPVNRCVGVPAGVADPEAAFVTLGVIALQGVRKAGIGFGDRVAVLGRGVLGMLAARLVRLAGASDVTIRGRTPASGRGEADRSRFDVVLDVTGNPDAVADAALIAAPGARVVLIGSSRGISPPLPSRGTGLPPIEIRGAHAGMRPERESVPGRWTFADEAELFMDWVSEGRLVPFDPPAETIDPREAWRFYRRLGRGEPPVGAALFDWRLLTDDLRSRRTTFMVPSGVFQVSPEQDRRAVRIPRLRGVRQRGNPRGASMSAIKGEESRKLGVALIGCGEIALHNAQAVAESGLSEVRWAIDTSLGLAHDLARRWGGRAAAEVAPALEDRQVNAFIICTPHHLHAPLCLQAVAAGKHVLVEKPIARTAPEAGTMIEAARAAGVVLSTFYPRRFLPEVLAAKSLVQQGALGRILGAKITEHLYRETSYWFSGSSGRSRSSWRTCRETSGGGVLLMNLCHHLDVLSGITGLRTGRVYCESGQFAAPGDVEDLVALTLRMTDGAIASVDASTCAPGAAESAFAIWGADGQIALDDPPRFLSLRQTALGAPGQWTRLPRGRERQARRDFVRAFAAAVLNGSANPVPPEEALAVQLVIDAAYRSAECREPLDVPTAPELPADVVSNR
jgi:UDP-N-acetyl-2-amino-2-deoxyglucuronate dehydrogenase